MYRNYDGKNRQFGNTAIKAGTGNQSRVGVYAATRSGDGALTIVVIKTSFPGYSITLLVLPKR